MRRARVAVAVPIVCRTAGFKRLERARCAFDRGASGGMGSLSPRTGNILRSEPGSQEYDDEEEEEEVV